ncbi:uncharacterized protein LOC131240740 isoform X2 [Magnolia sinica]|uniref:uncharacterized protein LOC131240740 isoform X2 n=1 Tax=Magnolia sinica TaxID=86752 RepID=UPI002659EFCB|nr:uncharacterized protein LOC131240740 isoform X2 [Magnolia sinica]
MDLKEKLIFDLREPDRRERAMDILSQQRQAFQDLGLLLWHSFGSVAVLLQEIVSIYHELSPPTLSASASKRVCNALALLQSIALHPETRHLLLNANIPVYLYPFLSIRMYTTPIEDLRLTSLGVIGTLVKVDDRESIRYLIETEVVPRCLLSMDFGSEISKIVATFILHKILMDDFGLQYACNTAERYLAISQTLWGMIASHSGRPGKQLLKTIIRCFLRLSDHPRAFVVLQNMLPQMLTDARFSGCLYDDPETGQWLQTLMRKVGVQADGLYHN